MTTSFKRNHAADWHQKVPGARWFKADLHIHTMDDIPGGRAKLPSGVHGSPESMAAITAYARCLLRSAIQAGVQVLGITPHSPRVGGGPETSTAWRIVEVWNSDLDDDGMPFRDKIYAVFPGFEPSLLQGKSGLHLLFLFDPEIGRDRYLRAFDLVMGGVSPWRKNELQLSNKTADEAFREIRGFYERESVDADGWNFMVLAPHIEADKGLLGAQKAQVLELFQHAEIAGLELGDDRLPEDTVKARPWLQAGMGEHRQAFFHASDAYAVDGIGVRHTWLKLASPRIEALRQSFIASDSRVRIAYQRDAGGELVEAPSPDITVSERPWLKSVTIQGKASFFGKANGNETEFRLSPDLTCIIGGSMTGKSTFLDGLRLQVGAPLPLDKRLKAEVEARGRDRFLGGAPEVKLDCPGRDPTAPLHQQWPAVFHAQNELHRLAQDPQAVEDILARLATSETRDIEESAKRLNALDAELQSTADRLKKQDEDLADAEQAFERAQRAAVELEAFSDAGVEEMHRASRNFQLWHEGTAEAQEIGGKLKDLIRSVASVEPLNIDEAIEPYLRNADVELSDGELAGRWAQLQDRLIDAETELSATTTLIGKILRVLKDREKGLRIDVERKLALAGVDVTRIKEFQSLNAQASLRASYEANLEQTRAKRDDAEQAFRRRLEDRRQIVEERRRMFDRVISTVQSQFGGRIAVSRIDNGHGRNLESFVKGMNQRGITRWWNDLDSPRPAPESLVESLEQGTLDDFGMSEAVQRTFAETVGKSRQRELSAIRCPDRYVLELRVDDGMHRPLDDLSGGQRVSILLSLLLEAKDERPLVIDQPEDELDNRYLFETVLPALKRLKGHRQIIAATHNANIVVNGDADHVILLEATAQRGHIEAAGAIEDPAVRDAIVGTVDGGDEAFRLRRLKYGF